jgi:hypothetical protein
LPGVASTMRSVVDRLDTASVGNVSGPYHPS